MKDHVYPQNPILLIDDENQLLQSYSFTLKESGINNHILCSDSRNVQGILIEQSIELVLLDLTMPYISGQEILKLLHENYPQIPVIIITGTNDVETAVNCMRQGAFDYILKPVNDSSLTNSVKKALQYQELLRENSLLKRKILIKQLKSPGAFSEIITQNSEMKAIFHYMEAIINSTEPVLITGETGVGKEMIAKALYNLTSRRGRFVAVNVAGLDDQMFTDTLFGHTKGAFTDAANSRIGLIEKANGGILFLDEIGDLSMASQVKLLRLLQEGEFYPLGSDTPRYIDTKIIVATNRNLFSLQEDGHFRKDLYYRLSVHNIDIPPLRERKDDLPLLIDHFLEQAAKNIGKKKPTIPYELITMLSNYHFPGNVRELRAMIFDAVASHRSGIMSLDKFTSSLEKTNYFKTSNRSNIQNSASDNIVKFSTVLPTLKDCQILLIKEAMKRADGNQSIASKLLGITRQGLNKRLKTIDYSH